MFRAKLNPDGSAGFESVPLGYKARDGEVLFADPPTEASLDQAFPARRKPAEAPPRDIFVEIDDLKRRLVAMEAIVAALESRAR